MEFTIREIADAVGGEACGDLSLTVRGAAEPGSATANELAMAMAPKYAEALADGAAQAAMLWADADWQKMGLKAAIRVPRPRMAMAGLTALLDPGQGQSPGIHPSAVIDPTASLGKNVSIGPLSVIGARARIGDRSVVGPHCFVGVDVELGEGAHLREMVSIGARVLIGRNFIAQPGARVGSDGFSFVTPEISGVEVARKSMSSDQGDSKDQSYVRIHSVGGVRIGDDVEIGANTAIDNGTIRATEIGDGTKLDNLVHIGHNVRIGKNCILAGQCGISGSVDIGNHVVLGGQCGVVDNIFIGDRAIATGASKILSNVPAGRIVMGYPAIKIDLHTDIYKAQRRLPRLFRDVAALRKAVFKSESSD